MITIKKKRKKRIYQFETCLTQHHAGLTLHLYLFDIEVIQKSGKVIKLVS